MMKTNPNLPSQNLDVYWIYTYFQSYQFKKPKSERESGKWLIFDHISEIDDTWEKVQSATIKGLLGPSSKVATAKPNPNAFDPTTKVICVYTEDFNDKLDVDRVAKAIRTLGIENKLIYKFDRDIGKYSKDGFSNLSQEVRYANKYEEVVAWLKTTPNDKYIRLLGTPQAGKSRFRFQRLDLSKAVFNQKIIRLKKLGFLFEKQSEIVGEEVVFIAENY